MAIGNFIPQVWAGTMLRYLDKTLVYGQAGVVNRDYEGEITGAGDVVKINQIGPITVGSYTKNTNISAPQDLAGDGTSLVIDQQKYFNFQVDDIDQAQQKPKVMETAMQRAAYAVADVVDQFIATTISATNAGVALTADTSMAADDYYNHLVELGVKLDEANVPSEGRWAIIPPWYDGGLRKEKNFFFANPLAPTMALNGAVGSLAGFNLMKSNNVYQPSAGVYRVIAGVDLALSFAQQIVSVEAFRPEARFADAVKGLNVYGAKLVVPSAVAYIDCTKP